MKGADEARRPAIVRTTLEVCVMRMCMIIASSVLMLTRMTNLAFSFFSYPFASHFTRWQCVYVFTHFLAPTIPLTAEVVFTRLNTPPKKISDLRADFYNLVPGTKVDLGSILFEKYP